MKPTCCSLAGFNVYSGDGFQLLIPSKWGPGKERDFPSTIFR